MSIRKRIAVLTSQLEEEYQKEFIEGFFQKAFSMDYDVCVFSSFQKEPESNLRSIGETNIFSLVNLALFDGVIVMPDVLQVSGLMMSIEKMLSEYTGKVLYVDRESRLYPYIMIDHYTPIYKLISHLIEEHNYSDIAFITGHKWHTHSKQRLNAYVDCMNDHNLAIPKDRIFYGDYWYDSGTNIIMDFIKYDKKMPEAFACANDYMAIGVAEALISHGFNVPEDIAVIGYDSVKEGQTCPTPITSIALPTRSFGTHAASCIDALINNTRLPEFINDSPIFRGKSCGCHNESVVPVSSLKTDWESLRTYFASFNRLTEDLVLQPTFKGLIDTVQTYSYQIREFELFYLCLNDVWVDNSGDIEKTIIKSGYTDYVVPILQCGPSGKGADKVDYESRIAIKDLLPQLHEECDHPRGFIFSPVFFDDITFGYSCISYGNLAQSYSESYYMWMRSIMTGIECYRRNATLQAAKNAAEEVQITDTLTGMFNYEGLIKHAKPMIERCMLVNGYISIIALDLSGLDKINSSFGRKEGDQAIHDLAKIIMDSADEGAMCCRLGNDEFIICEIAPDPSPSLVHVIQRRIDKKINDFNNKEGKPYKIKIFSGNVTDKVGNLSQMEDLVNSAVSHKNGNKANEHRLASETGKLSEEELNTCEIVKRILDENLFNYHFQPIVNAHDGSIFAYEALMRAQVQERISPLDIIKYANHLNRLIDVEKATFFNVTKHVSNNINLFDKKKVFINSIPGCQLVGNDAEHLHNLLTNLSDKVVVELTEQTEADDEALFNMKQRFQEMGIQTAVDDYGTGYSNIVNLLRYMPDYVKIDRMLLSNIQDNPQKQHFVKDIVSFAHDNHFKVLAEGIETSEELETVINLNVDLIQGYYTARPNPEIIQSIPSEISDEIKAFATQQ